MIRPTKWGRNTHQAQFLCFNTQLRSGVNYFVGRQSPLNYMKHLIRLVATDRDIKIQERGRQDTGGSEKDRFPTAAVRPRVIRFLIYGEHLMLLVRRERKRKGQFPKLRMCLRRKTSARLIRRIIRGETYFVIKPRFRWIN